MRPGGQKLRVQIWRNAQIGTSAYNEPIMGPVLWKETWAKMVARRGNEHQEGAQIFALTHFYFTFRYFSVQGIDPTFWLEFNAQKYDIKNISPDFEDKDNIVVEARVQDINAGLFALAINLTDAPADGVVGAAHPGIAPDATGGTAPYVFSISEGALPTGLAIDAGTGAITGTPTVAGDFSFVIQVVDANEVTAALPELEITIEEA